MNERLPMWVIYDRPTDHPTGPIARLWLSIPKPEATETTIAGTVEDLRRRFESMGYVCIGRQPGDDPKIVEVWI